MTVSIGRYAVIGNPVTHSKSPIIHTLFAASTQQQLRYMTLEVEQSQFESAVTNFFNKGGQGLSVTAPFKQNAWKLAKIKTEQAQQAGAVNTLWLSEEGDLKGDNTDGLGLIRDLQDNNNLLLSNLNVLILGAGGAARGIIAPLLHAQPAEIVIANRTTSRAKSLIDLFLNNYCQVHTTKLSACSFNMLKGPFDLIINATSASLQGKELAIPACIINTATVGYDMMYGAKETVFNQWARNAGAKVCLDGLGMLVEQAAEQFLIWRGIQPETGEVLQTVRKMLSQT
ncbi:MAG: shikimate dehydrogenase [Endozoicomonas sp. (ex Botrylloides leachii)]|nr:shikimate dehydrogenase [Endozoicomonas sp. (ex Botrylloides leachii)]